MGTVCHSVMRIGYRSYKVYMPDTDHPLIATHFRTNSSKTIHISLKAQGNTSKMNQLNKLPVALDRATPILPISKAVQN